MKLAVCKFWDQDKIYPDCPTCLGGWSSEGVETKIGINGEVICVSQHLTVKFLFLFFLLSFTSIFDF